MIPTPQQWQAATWHARQRWAHEHGVSLRVAEHVVLDPVARVAPLRAGDPCAAPEIDEELAASLAGDHDPLTVALRRAAVTGLPTTHPDVLAGLQL